MIGKKPHVEDSKRYLREILKDVPGVNGVGLTRENSRWILVVNIEREHWSSMQHVPQGLDGMPVRVNLIDPIEAL